MGDKMSVTSLGSVSSRGAKTNKTFGYIVSKMSPDMIAVFFNRTVVLNEYHTQAHAVVLKISTAVISDD